MTASHPERLAGVRAEMRARGVDYLIVRSTDRYLNEYVPSFESTREWLTGFTGSTGDALVGHDQAWVLVDGRYFVQVDQELDPALWTAVRVPLGTSIEAATAGRIKEVAAGGPVRVGYEPDRYDVKTFDELQGRLSNTQVVLVPLRPSPVETARGPVDLHPGTLRAIDETAAGRTVAGKVALVAAWLREQRVDALLVQKLDEIAYLANLRGDELPFQATFRSSALVTGEALLLAVHTATVPPALVGARPGLRFVSEDELYAQAAASGRDGRPPRIAADPASTTLALRDAIVALPAEVIALPSPVAAMKARKTPAELDSMRRSFARADRVVAEAQRWLQAQVAAGARITEQGFAEQVEALFLASGAVGLSFHVISAVGANGAIVHHPPSDDAVIHEGEILLLDTGAYYEDGFATDLTRTFFVGRAGLEPSAAQRRLYTLVLKSAIAGMTLQFPKGAVGAQLDGITRAPLWAEGLDYGHGTGHGVGINVHEIPPRIATVSVTPVEEGHVFSIEPGIYLENVGGVRIENLCTAVADPAHPGFLKIEVLTFSPLDPRLIEPALLDAREQAFLHFFEARSAALLADQG